MATTITGDATQRLKAIRANLSNERLRDLAIALGEAMLGELSTIERWRHGNIGRGLLQMSPPRPSGTGGWVVGIGSLGILGRPTDAAPSHTISEFRIWYREQIAKEKKPRVARITGAERVREAKRRLRRATIESMRLERLRLSVGLDAEQRMRDQVLEAEMVKQMGVLEMELSAKEYQRYMERWDRIFRAEEEYLRRRFRG